MQLSCNDGHCGLLILFNTSHFFPHVETFCVGHIIINYPFLEFGIWIHNCTCAGSGRLIFQMLQMLSIWDYEVKFKEAEFIFHCFKFHPQYISLRIVIFHPSLFQTVVCYNYYIGLIHNPDFLFYNLITSSFTTAVYEQCQDCGQCQYQLCILWSLLLWLNSNLWKHQLYCYNAGWC